MSSLSFAIKASPIHTPLRGRKRARPNTNVCTPHRGSNPLTEGQHALSPERLGDSCPAPSHSGCTGNLYVPGSRANEKQSSPTRSTHRVCFSWAFLNDLPCVRITRFGNPFPPCLQSIERAAEPSSMEVDSRNCYNCEFACTNDIISRDLKTCTRSVRMRRILDL